MAKSSKIFGRAIGKTKLVFEKVILLVNITDNYRFTWDTEGHCGKDEQLEEEPGWPWDQPC